MCACIKGRRRPGSDRTCKYKLFAISTRFIWLDLGKILPFFLPLLIRRFITSARSSNSDGEEADDDKATQAKTREYPPKKAVKHKAEKKREETGPNRRKMEKRKNPCKPRCDFLQCDLFTWGK